MIHQVISSSNIQMHVCTIERVYNSGLIDARSTRDKFFEQINFASHGAETNYTPGQRCIVLSDGTQHIAIGQLTEPRTDSNGRTTVRNLENDLSDLTQAKALVATDGFGSQSRVVVSPGAGVILDSGENSIIHLDPGNNQIMEIADRKETITVPLSVDIDHDGVVASSKYKWRTTADLLSWDRDVARERDDSLDLGGVLTAEVGPAPDVLKIEYKVPVVGTIAQIEIEPDGTITAQSGPSGLGKVQLNPLGGVELRSPVSALTIGGAAAAPPGGITLGNGVVDLLDLFDQTLTQLSAATTITLLGPSPLVNAPAFGIIQGLLAQIKG